MVKTTRNQYIIKINRQDTYFFYKKNTTCLEITTLTHFNIKDVKFTIVTIITIIAYNYNCYYQY